jgi:hypothetical protein
MSNARKTISPALFGLGLFCFFLPFITVSCQQREVATLNGIELAGGKEIKTPAAFGQASRTKRTDGDPLAALAILSGLVGLGGSFIRVKKSAVIPAGAGAAGFILLLMLQLKINDAISKESAAQGLGLIGITYTYGLGYWLAFILYLSAMLVNIYGLISEKDETDVSSDQEKV